MKKKILISCSNSKEVEYWILKKNYSLLKKQIISVKGTPQPLKFNKNKKLLYIGIKNPNKIITYKLSNNNIFKKKNEINIFNTPNYITLYKKKKILFCASYHGNGFIVFILNKNGLIKKKIYIFKKIIGCHSIKIFYKYKLIYITALKEDKIYIYKIKNIKNKIYLFLKNIIYTTKNSGPRHIIFHPIKNYLYSINELNGTIDVWNINNSSYLLILQQSISLIPKKYTNIPWSSEIHIHPNEKYLYACDRSNNIITFFIINKNTGHLSYIKSYKTEIQPRSFNISKDGKILIVLGELSNSMTIYAIKNGYLIFKKKQLIGKNPLWILIE
ncbi:beta-propeller fold lactonase family protein [Buchnera aphidicola]|uniref:6-phosphogluconolactonase, cycloisomerase 2 family n=1 Tax=Buchnera aphidicola subsp. Cinara cedri (strain Cc) TaxID=372461 RepID=Q057P8_BUCCC|nr:beta-propeller fold lactonase family protein [Buchnera aphidicola]ABJ90651.1 6-phosphogluconolactonase, cycloisomerase 2 family [Buchnera aphidicola BCc]